MRRTRKTLIASMAVAIGAVAIAPTGASADDDDSSDDGASTAPVTLADVLLSDSAKDNADGFDRRSRDYDIVTQAILATDADGNLLFPDLVAGATNPDAELTAFLPNDAAFRRLVYEISGQWIRSEAEVFAAVVGLGVETVGNVLAYHVVPAKISYRDALASNGATIPTLLDGATLDVKVKRFFWFRYVQLVDADTNDRDARVVRPNIGGEAANGFAHGINRVMRPIDLP